MTYRPPFPDQTDVTRSMIEDALARMEGPGPGRVQAYDAASQTADVVPLLRLPVPQGDGSFTFEAGPVVPRVPVIFQRAAGFAVTFPIVPGDLVLLIPCGGDIGTWWGGDGDVTTPQDVARHHLAHAVAIPGLYPNAKALQNPSSNFRLGLDTADATGTVEITSEGKVIVSGGGTPVAKEGSGTTGHAHSYALTAGPYVVTGTIGNVATGNTDMDTIATGQGSQNVLVP